MLKSNKKPKKNIGKIYMDYASGALFSSANPGAIHQLGVQAKKMLNQARGEIAEILGAHTDEIVFTSGATESNNLAILGIAQNFKTPHIVTTNIEHASVLETCKYLEKTKRAKVTYVPVEANGIIDPKKIRKALKPNTILVSVMYANNEIGAIEPLREIAKEIRHYRKASKLTSYPLFHTDATQAINYLPIGVEKLGVDLLSFNGAKIYGPKGIGALYVKRKTPISPIMFGGNQEFGLRPGTENVNGAKGLAQALRVVEGMKEKESKRLIGLRDYFIKKLQAMDKKIILNGDKEKRLPNNVNITIPKIPSDLLVIELSERGIYLSEKSACKSGEKAGSYVIEALRPVKGLTVSGEAGSLRFSLGRKTSKAQIDYTLKALSEILTKLKRWYN